MFHRANQKIPSRKLVVEELSEGVITNENGYIRIEQLDKVHHSAFISIVNLPSSMFGSAFIQNLRDSLSFPLESHQRLRFEHEQKDIRTINKMRKRIFEQDKEQLNVDGVLDDDEVVLFGEERLKELRNHLKAKDIVATTIRTKTRGTSIQCLYPFSMKKSLTKEIGRKDIDTILILMNQGG